MDFSFTETQEAIRGMLKKVFAELVTDESLKAIQDEGTWFHQGVWEALAQSQMLGIALPESVGGAGLGLIELSLMLQQVGRAVAPVPVLSTLVMGALPIAEFGTEAQKQRFLPGVIKGERFLTASLSEVGSQRPGLPVTRAERDGAGWRLSGVRHSVPDAALASHMIVPARTGPQSVGVFLVDLKAEGVSVAEQRATNDEPMGEVRLEGVAVGAEDVLGDPLDGAGIVAWIVQRATLGLCALELGVVEKALFMTASYTTQRKQFGVPIGSFQAVSQRAGDAYIDVEAMKVAFWHAAWRLEEGMEGADKSLAIARFWASDGGHRVVAAAQHLHGGMGFDRDYPLHRHFLWSKRIEFTLGGASAQLARLGDLIAGESGRGGMV